MNTTAALEDVSIICVYSLGNQAAERSTRVTVQIPRSSPITDASDAAWERIEARHPAHEINFIDEL